MDSIHASAHIKAVAMFLEGASVFRTYFEATARPCLRVHATIYGHTRCPKVALPIVELPNSSLQPQMLEGDPPNLKAPAPHKNHPSGA